jgi:hypothetical protein
VRETDGRQRTLRVDLGADRVRVMHEKNLHYSPVAPIAPRAQARVSSSAAWTA